MQDTQIKDYKVSEVDNTKDSIIEHCEFYIEKHTLEKSLSSVYTVVSKRTTIPILSHIKISVQKNNMLQITATDIDSSIIVDHVPAIVKKSADFTISAHLLYDLIRKMPQEVNLCFKTNDTHAEISTMNSKFSLAILPSEQFPEIANHKPTQVVKLSAHLCYQLFDKVKFSIFDTEVLYHLNGVYLLTDNDQFLAVAMDKHRLACITVGDSIAKDTQNTGLIIPKKAVHEIMRLINARLHKKDEPNPEVTLSIAQHNISMTIENVHFTSKLIDAKFPDYKSVFIPYDDKHKFVTFNVMQLKSTIERVTTISTDRSCAIKIHIQQDTLRVFTKCKEQHHNATESLELVENKDNASLEITLNSRYILDILSHLGSETADILFTTSFQPIRIAEKLSPDKVNSMNSMYVVSAMWDNNNQDS